MRKCCRSICRWRSRRRRTKNGKGQSRNIICCFDLPWVLLKLPSPNQNPLASQRSVALSLRRLTELAMSFRYGLSLFGPMDGCLCFYFHLAFRTTVSDPLGFHLLTALPYLSPGHFFAGASVVLSELDKWRFEASGTSSSGEDTTPNETGYWV